MIFPAQHVQQQLRAAAAASRLDDADFGVIAALVLTAREGGGWRRRGVRGWLFYREIEALLGSRVYMPCSLNDLARRRGLVTGLEIRDYANGRFFLYRANELSARVFDHALGQEHQPLAATPNDNAREDGRMLFMPLGSWAALSALRDAREKLLARPRWGEHGWLRTREMSTVLGERAWIDTTDCTGWSAGS